MNEPLPLICCFTGHRRIDPDHITPLSEEVGRALDILIQRGITCFRTGGAIGFDTLAALKILEKREAHPHLTFELCLPCRDQTVGWRPWERSVFEQIRSRADRVVYLSETYDRGCMARRNRYMVDHSVYCIAYCTSDRGGTAYTISYAQKKGVPVLNLANCPGLSQSIKES